ncbi:hypothetical protein A2W13_01900 [Candidatus Woesebacteria bacterium RBG_16_36_11]|uniref:Uncharacterized protein n=3 Tax=Candidatus Woeseibacteriota TaxID=1752722 RepID=A0A1F7XBG0_9BACT|nr:MAG: hypothetical protein A2Z67_04175 [Candidatus Woesebacteria bacterium RBG_13_36_22]OGM12374.1 MAG: hypothetical protein A2W13_01900 [Candidatus Woesebacteria bacterium RBG_16_36_11]OGM17207.1 MAG: hypothetical protein A2V55_01530 [Candidatus Woesebacteria bacterium RBG_19FT_COMBO_37_29]
MVKRTKKEKLGARHPFFISWEKAQSTPPGDVVKGQTKIEAKSNIKKISDDKNANIQDKEPALNQIKRDMIRSLTLASLILGLEMVLYFVWH